MALSSGLERPIRLLPRCQPWPRQVFASSLVLHVLGFALAGWVTHGRFRTLISASGEQVTRAYALHYLVLTRPPTRSEPRPEPLPERRPPSPPAPAAVVTAPATLPVSRNVVDSASRSMPRRSAIQTQELAPGETLGIGQMIPTPHSDSAGRGGVAGLLGLRVPMSGGQPARRGFERVAELVGVAGSACPELRPPAVWSKRHFAVAVTFVVDTSGAVDPATLRVIESPARPQTEHRFHSRIYVVGATVRSDPGDIDPTAYDSVVTAEVASHVAGLAFRPAMREGRAIRSTVLVSCQTS